MWLGGHTYFRIDNAPECSVEAKQECCWKRRIFGAERRVGGQEFFFCVSLICFHWKSEEDLAVWCVRDMREGEKGGG